MKNSITAILITLNEEDNIEKCLQSIAWVDEIIVVDSGSKDRTEEISKKYTKNFFYSEWSGFGRQKQKLLTRRLVSGFCQLTQMRLLQKN